LLGELDPKARTDVAVDHALKVREAVALSNYHAFFKLYNSTPNKGSFLLNRMLLTKRLEALQTVIKAYKPTSIPLGWLYIELAFKEKLECEEFLKLHGVVLVKEAKGELAVDTKQSIIQIS